MSTLIWYNSTRRDYYILKTPEKKWFGVTRADCIESNSLDITSEDLDRAEANPETWISCPQDSKLTTVIAERDALLKACKLILPDLQHYFRLYPCDKIGLRLKDTLDAIAEAESEVTI